MENNLFLDPKKLSDKYFGVRGMQSMTAGFILYKSYRNNDLFHKMLGYYQQALSFFYQAKNLEDDLQNLQAKNLEDESKSKHRNIAIESHLARIEELKWACKQVFENANQINVDNNFQYPKIKLN